MTGGVGSKSELLNVLGDVKARVQDKLGFVDFPMPQFILIGKQSVGKSRLIEALAGECFNFISGTLGSRRPTVLEFRNSPNEGKSKWYVRDRKTNAWQQHPIDGVMRIVGNAHEECGKSVSHEPVYVRVESSSCVDMQIVDLPGFRDFALDPAQQELADKIKDLVQHFMNDKRNVMLCVEQAGDAATMSTLAKCRAIDPEFQRTILIRNKLDKFYADLTSDNVTKWVDGFGDLPESLIRFALTLPHWKEGDACPVPFTQMREKMNDTDLNTMSAVGLSKQYLKTIGFKSFVGFMEKKIEQMFAQALNPVLSNLQDLKTTTDSRKKDLEVEFENTDPNRILSTTRDCGISFATALTHVMEGVLDLEPVQNLEEELRAFHSYHQSLGNPTFALLPSQDFFGLNDYIDYLRNEIRIATFEVEVNGGAQFRRLMMEVEIFLRFSEIAVEIKKRDVIQARGVTMGSLTWRDVVVKLLSHEAHLPLQRRIAYVGERVKWFFESQKDAVLEFMERLENSPSANLYSPLLPRHAKLIKQNAVIKHAIWETYNNACARQLRQFVELFENMLTSTFSNPWVSLKGGTTNLEAEGELADAMLPSFEDTKCRIPKEIEGRSGMESNLSKWLSDIPTEPHEIDQAVDKVQMLVLKTYGFIRSQVCDQVELFAESFFKLPMMRRLEEDMATIELTADDKANYQARRERLRPEIEGSSATLLEINKCIEDLQNFKLKCEARS